MGPDVLAALPIDLARTVRSQIVEHGCLHDDTFAEVERAVVRAQSPFWDIQINPSRSRKEKDQAHRQMVELADMRRSFRMWTKEGLERG